jgi:predicted O-methyltransferase YrrM
VAKHHLSVGEVFNETGSGDQSVQVMNRRRTHSEVLAEYLLQLAPSASPVIVEVGIGLTSAALAKYARDTGATYYACDLNADLVSAVRDRIDPDKLIKFRIGDSESVLGEIVQEVGRVDFAFLDSAASAMKTFREFQIVEPKFEAGSILVIDNAAIPGTNQPLRSRCRKGKIVVPYLLASPFWEVIGHPNDGDSMIAAIKRSEPDFADEAYEDVHGVWSSDLGWRRRVP